MMAIINFALGCTCAYMTVQDFNKRKYGFAVVSAGLCILNFVAAFSQI